MWRHRFIQIKISVLDDCTVTPDLIGDAEVLRQIRVVKFIDDGEQALVLVVCDDTGGALNILEFGEPGMRDAIR